MAEPQTEIVQATDLPSPIEPTQTTPHLPTPEPDSNQDQPPPLQEGNKDEHQPEVAPPIATGSKLPAPPVPLEPPFPISRFLTPEDEPESDQEQDAKGKGKEVEGKGKGKEKEADPSALGAASLAVPGFAPGEYIYPDIPPDKLADREWLESMKTGLTKERESLQGELQEMKNNIGGLLYKTTILQSDLMDEVRATKEAMERLKGMVDPKWMDIVMELTEDAVETGELKQVDDFLSDDEEEDDEEDGDEEEDGNDEGGSGDDNDDDADDADDDDDGHDDSLGDEEALEGESLDSDDEENNQDEKPASEDTEEPETQTPEPSASDSRSALKRQITPDDENDMDEEIVENSIRLPERKRRRLSGGSEGARSSDSEVSASDEETSAETSSRAENKAVDAASHALVLSHPLGSPIRQSTPPAVATTEMVTSVARSPVRSIQIPNPPSPPRALVTTRRRAVPLRRHFERVVEDRVTGEPIVIDMTGDSDDEEFKPKPVPQPPRRSTRSRTGYFW